MERDSNSESLIVSHLTIDGETAATSCIWNCGYRHQLDLLSICRYSTKIQLVISRGMVSRFHKNG